LKQILCETNATKAMKFCGLAPARDGRRSARKERETYPTQQNNQSLWGGLRSGALGETY